MTLLNRLSKSTPHKRSMLDANLHKISNRIIQEDIFYHLNNSNLIRMRSVT